MNDLFDLPATLLSLSWPELLALALVAGGLFVMVVGAATAFSPESAVLRRRIRAATDTGLRNDIVRPWDNDPTGALRLFVPLSGRERLKVAAKLRQAGIHAPRAVRRFFLIRSLLAALLPAAFLALAWFGDALPDAVTRFLAPLTRLTPAHAFMISVGLLALGFYGPALWLRHRISTRKTAIERGFPGALDLMQVAIEAGHGFDVAMNRVASDIRRFCPALADEFTIMQLEIQAGKPRDEAFRELERRTGLAEMAAFANVVQQATEFGTPVSEALEAYAIEMRNDRELRAQTKANQLPVKMSGVLAACMMPVLLLIMLTPIAIRWVTVM
ncbi:tight adherence protein C [Roseivivax lentus]|uniref:Tight adherence protein C n=1 Tax=Roseivivax lentus TaxID=633194 RepID=A0A1N7M921_9RHOB|nr:type II secretion system F family protein [Roseivivax lentus]SIS82615.1 tight adherence protein C [Roseivivax lentus]